MSTTRRRFVTGIAGGSLAGAATAANATEKAATMPDPATFLPVFPKRQTVRRYKPDAVPEEHLRQILDAARRGPTCMNQQPWMFLVIRDRAKIEAMRKRTLDLLAKNFDDYAAQHKEAGAAELEKKKKEATRFTEGYFTAPA